MRAANRGARGALSIVSIPSAQNTTPVTSRNQLIELLESGCKPPEEWLVGTEHEKFAYDAITREPLSYDAPNGIRVILEELQRFGWQPLMEGDHIIGLKKDRQHVSLEPGGQVELSGAPLKTLHEACREVNAHLDQCQEVAEELGIIFLGLGLRPLDRRQDVPWMPKGRYRIMREYMQKVGTMGLDMMVGTCTIQANLGFRVRGGHGAEVQGRPGAAGGDDRAFRQLAIQRGKAERLPVDARPHLDGYRQ